VPWPIASGQVPAALGALPENLGGDLAVLGVVLLALVCARLTGFRIRLGDVLGILGTAGHQPAMERGNVGDVTTEPGTLLHLFTAETLVCTPLRDLGRLSTEFDTLALFVAQPADLGDCLREGHCDPSLNRGFGNGGACICWPTRPMQDLDCRTHEIYQLNSHSRFH
jgi:hypothetical protein